MPGIRKPVRETALKKACCFDRDHDPPDIIRACVIRPHYEAGHGKHPTDSTRIEERLDEGCPHVCGKGGGEPRRRKSVAPVLEGAAPWTAACPSLEGRAGDGWMRLPGKRQRSRAMTGTVTPAPLSQPARCAMQLNLTGDADPLARSDDRCAGAAPPCRTPGDHR